MARIGLPAKYAKMGFKKGWKAYKAAKARTSRTRRLSQSPGRKGVRKMARRKRRRRKSRTIPILPLIGTVGPMVAIAKEAWDSGWGIEGVVDNLAQSYTGYSTVSGDFDFNRLKRGLLPAAAGIVAHKVANMLGINRTFANLPSPLNKLRL